MAGGKELVADAVGNESDGTVGDVDASEASLGVEVESCLDGWGIVLG